MTNLSEEEQRKERLYRIKKLKNPSLKKEDFQIKEISEEEKERLANQLKKKQEEEAHKKNEEKFLRQIHWYFKVDPKNLTLEEIHELGEVMRVGMETDINLQEIALLKALGKLFKK